MIAIQLHACQMITHGYDRPPYLRCQSCTPVSTHTLQAEHTNSTATSCLLLVACHPMRMQTVFRTLPDSLCAVLCCAVLRAV